MPKGIRPTQNKVRKALVDILGDIEGVFFLELFAGSGAVGLEAASQGVKEVVFVENNPVCIKMLKENLSYLPLATYRLLPIDAFKAIERLAKEKEKFDIVFLDPPYYKEKALRFRLGSKATESESLTKKTLKMVSTCDIVAPNGLIVVQHFKKNNLPDAVGDLVLFKQARYADTVLSFYRKEG